MQPFGTILLLLLSSAALVLLGHVFRLLRWEQFIRIYEYPQRRSLLRAIIEMYNGGPVGLETLAAALGEEAVTLEDLCEPYLMQMGFLTRTPRGRCATRLAYEHLGMKAPEIGSAEENGQQSLF